MMDKEQELAVRIGRLPRSMAPPRDLWPEIEAGLTPRHHRIAWLGSVAAGLAVIAMAAVVLWGGSGLAPDDLGDETALASSAGSGLLYANSIDLQYTGPLKALATQINARVEPGSAGEVTLGLRTLNHAAEEIRAAIARDPNSLYLVELLESTHRKRVQLLKDLALSGAGREEPRST